MSTPTDKDPRPKVQPSVPASTVWPVRRIVRCPPVIAPPAQDFSTIIETRRSSRVMQPAPLREIVNLIAFTTRPRFVRENDLLLRSRRLSPSAGALHPLDVLVLDWRGSRRLLRYDAWAHQLEVLAVRQRQPLHSFIHKCADILPAAQGTAIVLLGDLATVRAAYENPISLLWRDAGALLQTLALTATAYRLAFCPLGILGGEIVQALELNEDHIQPVGIGVIGRHRDETS